MVVPLQVIWASKFEVISLPYSPHPVSLQTFLLFFFNHLLNANCVPDTVSGLVYIWNTKKIRHGVVPCKELTVQWERYTNKIIFLDNLIREIINSGCHGRTHHGQLRVPEELWSGKGAAVDQEGCYTEWSKPERKTPIQYTNAYIWNLERW